MRPELQAIGDRLRAARLHANRTQDDAASATGIDRRTIQRLERGETDGRLSWVLLLAREYGIPPRDLFDS